ncbi:armadillo repeat-containing protein 4-like [Stylophora pistillata]|uniref:Armadillo repeat-containing protein 4 n=1 Tax=Stylophora pistillata TaxID=50429 RepID=A0A2B4SNB9_STYPI|nr:armadillo repeat-containing protein 4-like [Stylophora pistillata]PFX30563.1 Armadillo repeat-containing protein 4 [Stylophora pistillata]
MGATISSRIDGTSVSEYGKGKLEFTPQNEALLNDIVKQVESLVSSYPREAETILKEPFKWHSTLNPDNFGELNFGSMGFQITGSDVKSEAKTPNGEHLLSMDKEGENFILKVWTFEQIGSVLKAAGDRKCQEAQACLEENQDPMANVMGAAYAAVSSSDRPFLKALADLSKAREQSSENVEEQEARFTLSLLISEMDKQLLEASHKTIAKEVRLNPSAVQAEYELFKSFAGEKGQCLEYIEWTLDHQFSNGCHAPPWQQVHGDISYLDIKPFDNDKLTITANTAGYFLNKGLTQEGQVNFERVGDVYPTLVALLKAKSPQFATAIEKKEFAYYGSSEEKQDRVEQIDKPAKDEEPNGSAAEEAVDVETKNQINAATKTKATKTSQKKKGTKGAKTYETSPRWKNINIEFGADLVGNDLKKGQQKGKSTPDKKPSSRLTKSRDAGKNTRVSMRSQMKGDMDEDFSESSSESEEEEESQDRRQESNADLPSEYWQIQKLVKYLKSGNQTATIIALCAMRDFNLQQETCQLAIRDVGGLEVLINLLETNEIKCKIGSLKILREISRNSLIRKAIADLGGLQTMVKLLQGFNDELKCLAAETIAHVARFRRARRTVRQYGGIRKLVSLLDCGTLVNASDLEADVARCGALALWSCSKSTKNKQAIRKAGGIPLLARLLKSSNEAMLIPVVGTLQECASEASYRLAIRTEGMIGDLVRNLKSENQELQMHCASAIFKCAEDDETRELVRKYGGLDPLVSLSFNVENKELLAAATGAIWKCSISRENVTRFQELKAIEQLVSLLTEQPEEVLINVVGALGECAKVPANRATIRKAGGIPSLVNLLTSTNQALLVNVTNAVGACATEPDNMAIIDRLDGVRLLWSLLKSNNPKVQSSAAWAICPCIENAKDAGEMVRSFVGGLELIVSLLKSNDREVLASVCAAIANIAKDEENLAVITDHGVVPMLAKLATTTDDRLRQYLAESIARCCTWGNNRVAFGQAGAVPPLVYYLKSKNPDVHRATARALHQLSRDPDNCISMHNSGVVKYLLEMVGSSDEVLQEAAAGCLGNIRRLALANEKARYN